MLKLFLLKRKVNGGFQKDCLPPRPTPPIKKKKRTQTGSVCTENEDEIDLDFIAKDLG